jgi:gluconolactonase
MTFTDDSGKSNGLKFDADGNLIACCGADHGSRAVVRFDVKTGKKTVLVDSYQGKRLNSPNDLVIDRKGRIYFSDPRYVGPEPRDLKTEAVYRLDDQTLREVTTKAEKPNGVALSPDQKTLYVADHNSGSDRVDVEKAGKPGAMKLLAFALDEEGLVKGAPRELIDFGTEAGIDGMTVDEKGNLYLAVRSLKRPGVLVTSPDGKEVAFIPTGRSQAGAREPVGIPSNCTFGIGDERSTLYVTVDKSLYRIKLKVPGLKQPFEK